MSRGRARTTLNLPGVAAMALLLGGCAARPAGAGVDRLAYGEPHPNPVAYDFTDSATFAVEAPGYGVMEVVTAQRGTAELWFQHAAPGGYQVRVRFPSFEGTFDDPRQGVSRVDASDIGGAVGVEVSATGDVMVVDTPRVTPALLDVVGPERLVQPFFVHLPGRPAAAGDRWVDTVRTREEGSGRVSRGTSVITSTLAGDTVVDARRLLRILIETETAVEVSGVAGGVAVEQELRGTSSGVVLWDPGAHRLVERREQGELSGTLEIADAGVDPLPVSARVRRRVSLRP